MKMLNHAELVLSTVLIFGLHNSYKKTDGILVGIITTLISSFPENERNGKVACYLD